LPTDQSELSKNQLRLIEDELEDAINSVLNRVEFQNQISWSKTILQAKADHLEQQMALADAELEKVQSTADKMHCALYNSCPVVHKNLPALEIETSVSDFVVSLVDYLDFPLLMPLFTPATSAASWRNSASANPIGRDLLRCEEQSHRQLGFHQGDRVFREHLHQRQHHEELQDQVP